MPHIYSVATVNPPYRITQELAFTKAQEHFSAGFSDIDRLLKIFQNTEIEARYFSVPLEWFFEEHSLRERNDLYIEGATNLGEQAIAKCLGNRHYLKHEVEASEIEAIYFVSTTGMATPSIDARIMNRLPFSRHTRRIPIWGLGCAGGVAGMAQGWNYCLAFPRAKVLVVNLELCSLTFQKQDLSKSNLIGASIFGDGAACTLIGGDEAEFEGMDRAELRPRILDHQTTLMPDSEAVMGWDLRDEGLFVVFSKDIPTIIRGWLRGNVDEFLASRQIKCADIGCFIAHPGGRKILEAYQDALEIPEEMTAAARSVLRSYGNMSSPSVIFVLDEVMRGPHKAGELGLMMALGPGFSSELMLLTWE